MLKFEVCWICDHPRPSVECIVLKHYRFYRSAAVLMCFPEGLSSRAKRWRCSLCFSILACRVRVDRLRWLSSALRFKVHSSKFPSRPSKPSTIPGVGELPQGRIERGRKEHWLFHRLTTGNDWVVQIRIRVASTVFRRIIIEYVMQHKQGLINVVLHHILFFYFYFLAIYVCYYLFLLANLEAPFWKQPSPVS